jgi:hypothetical protein
LREHGVYEGRRLLLWRAELGLSDLTEQLGIGVFDFNGQLHLRPLFLVADLRERTTGTEPTTIWITQSFS